MVAEKPPEPTKREEWASIYSERYPVYQELAHKLADLIAELLQKHGIETAQIERRAKSPLSVLDKIQREGKNYGRPLEEITDLVGIRVIAYYKDDVDRIGEILKTEFDIDVANSVDKAQAADPDRFGYVSVHYVVSLSEARKQLTEWAAFADIKAEIQVKTVLQHAWAALDHKLRYKAAREAPRDLRRQLFRLIALLEVADEEFLSLRRRSREIERRYSQELAKGSLHIPVDAASLDGYLRSTSSLLKWQTKALEAGFNPVKSEDVEGSPLREHDRRRLLKVLTDTRVCTISDLDRLLEQASGWGENMLIRICRISSDNGFTPYAVPYDVIILLVLCARREFLTEEVLEATYFAPGIKKAIGEVT